jgi:CSLREA domain-containing protein
MRAVLLACVGVAMLASPAAAATFVVNSTADTVDADTGVPACADARGKCTLRAAIMQANFTAGADVIKLPAGTFKLTRPGNNEDGDVLGDLDVTDSVTLVGKGAAKTIIDGNGAVTKDRVLQITSGAKTVTIAGLTIGNGQWTAGAFDSGGGLDWDGGAVGGSQLTLRDLVIENNRASYDGGIALNFATSNVADLERLVIRHNQATAAGGGLGASLSDGSELVVRGSRIEANTAYEGAGVALQASGPSSATIDSTVIDANHATGLNGGVENRATLAMHGDTVVRNVGQFQGGGVGNLFDLTVERSTFSGNSSAKGAGIYTSAGGTTNIVNSTISGNAAGQYGGGIYGEKFTTSVAAVSLANVTLAGNSAGTAGAGIYRDDPSVGIALTDTLVAKGSRGGNCGDSGIGSVGAANLSDDDSCGFGLGNGVPDLHLGPLGDHGGPTATQVPGAGSQAVDGGSGVGAPATDQRGVARPQGTVEDVGAVEVCQLPPRAPAVTGPPKKVKSRRPTLSWTGVTCLEGYTVEVRRRSKSGHTVERALHVHGTSLVTRKLRRRTVYYWRVTAVGDRGAAVSSWHRFKVG